MSPARRILIPVARSFHTVSAMKARRVTTSHDEPLCIFNACSLNNDVCTNKTTSETILRPRGEQKADGAQRTRLVLHSDLTQWMIDSEGGCFFMSVQCFSRRSLTKKAPPVDVCYRADKVTNLLQALAAAHFGLSISC